METEIVFEGGYVDKFNNPSEIIKLVKSLDLRYKHDYAICGGAMMVIRGIKPATHDIDILISHEAFQEQMLRSDIPWSYGVPLGSSSPHCLRWNDIELLDVKGFRKVPQLKEFITRADIIQASEGEPLVQVSDTIIWKVIADRPQDRKDIELIKAWYLT